VDCSQALWEAAAKVFEIPAWDAVAGWLAGGPVPALREQTGLHSGPCIGLMHDFEGPRGVHVVTDGHRSVDLLHDSYDNWVVTIEFPMPGSLIAAGEVARHVMDMLLSGCVEIILANNTCVDLDNYLGPVGCNLYLARQGLPMPVMLKHAERGRWRFAGNVVTVKMLPELLAAIEGRDE